MASVEFSHIHEALHWAAVPEFGPTIDEHVAEYYKVLPHVLFGDLTRFVLAAHQRNDADLEGRCLEFLDHALREGDDQTQNLVGVSFVENVGPWEQAQREFIDSWPDALRSEAECQRNWNPRAIDGSRFERSSGVRDPGDL